ncbi:MAG: pilus assembly protein PilM, partial [Candidatus Omnitrophota bacterium]
NKLLNKFSLPKFSLGKLLGKVSQDWTAINLGSSCLKGIIVEQGKAVDYFVEENIGLAAAIEKLSLAEKIPAKKVKICLKSPNCLVRYFSFPKMERQKMSQALFYELNKFIPFPPEEVCFDFFVLGEANPKEFLILLAAAKKDFINETLEVFEKNSLEVLQISLDSICIVNLFLNNYQPVSANAIESAAQANACLLDIGYKSSTMTLVHKGAPFITRDLNFSAEDVFKVAARIKNLTLVQIKEQVLSGKQTNEFLESAGDSFFNLRQEMKNSFEYFEVNKGERVDKLYLSGGFASVKGVESSFTGFPDLKVEVLKIFPEPIKNVGEVFLNKTFEPLKNSFSAVFGIVL